MLSFRLDPGWRRKFDLMNSDEGKIFVGGLHWNTTNEGLKAYFEKFGQVLECNIMRDPTGRSRCFGFVLFADPVVVDVVLQKTHILDKKQIDPKRAVPKEQQQSIVSIGGDISSYAPSNKAAKEEHKVFVGGVHVDVETEELTAAFTRYGEVVETILMRDRETGKSRGFGFVTFSTLESAHKACDDGELQVRNRKVEIKMAVPKGRPVPGRTAAAQGGMMMFNSSTIGGTGAGSSDPYTAWLEYYKQHYPQYYESMMKTYSNPAAMAAYYSQYYGGGGGGGVGAAEGYNGSGVEGGSGGGMYNNSGNNNAQQAYGGAGYDPAQYMAMMNAMTGGTQGYEPKMMYSTSSMSVAAAASASQGYRPEGGDNDRYSHRRSRRSRSRSPRSRSRDRKRSRSRSRSRSTSRSRRDRHRRDSADRERPSRDREYRGRRDKTADPEDDSVTGHLSPRESSGDIKSSHGDSYRPEASRSSSTRSSHHPYSRSNTSDSRP